MRMAKIGDLRNSDGRGVAPPRLRTAPHIKAEPVERAAAVLYGVMFPEAVHALLHCVAVPRF